MILWILILIFYFYWEYWKKNQCPLWASDIFNNFVVYRPICMKFPPSSLFLEMFSHIDRFYCFRSLSFNDKKWNSEKPVCQCLHISQHSENILRYINLLLLSFHAPNFKEVEGAYWFGPFYLWVGVGGCVHNALHMVKNGKRLDLEI